MFLGWPATRIDKIALLPSTKWPPEIKTGEKTFNRHITFMANLSAGEQSRAIMALLFLKCFAFFTNVPSFFFLQEHWDIVPGYEISRQNTASYSRHQAGASMLCGHISSFRYHHTHCPNGWNAFITKVAFKLRYNVTWRNTRCSTILY